MNVIIFFNVSDVRQCQTEPCRNGGTCYEGAGRYHCQCVRGFQGENCLQGKNFNVLIYNIEEFQKNELFMIFQFYTYFTKMHKNTFSFSFSWH